MIDEREGELDALLAQLLELPDEEVEGAPEVSWSTRFAMLVGPFKGERDTERMREEFVCAEAIGGKDT